jgi:RecQ family ATP-dependent DNA helicase
MMQYEAARQVLKKHFGYDDFRGAQKDAIRSILAGKDTLVLMPTGGGKSLCFQIPAMVLAGPTLVISPLISLMKDQVDNACRAGIPATFVNSTLPYEEVRQRMNGVRNGHFRLLYFAPERAENPRFIETLKQMKVAMLAVDEAHCLSQWGHEFRPSYLKLGALREALQCRVIALTATATPEVRRDIVTHLRMMRPTVLASGFDRPNLKWHVLAAEKAAEKDSLLLRLLKRERTGPALVFASTRKRVDAIADYLNARSIRASGYHAGVKSAERTRLQESFMSEQAGVVVATNAFGMGIDKPNVRLVVHYDMPGSLEAYYQEGGRAGRDGKDSNCVLLHAYADRFTHLFMIDGAHPSADTIRRVLKHAPAVLSRDNAVQVMKATQTNRREYGSVLRVLKSADVLEPEAETLIVKRRSVSAAELAQSQLARERELLRLRRMEGYAYYRACRRSFVLEYFGATLLRGACAGCDNCNGEAFMPQTSRPISRYPSRKSLRWLRLSLGLLCAYQVACSPDSDKAPTSVPADPSNCTSKGTSYSGTYTSGLWRVADGPHHIIDTVFVNGAFVIEPGATVCAARNARLIIDAPSAILSAIGSELNPIRFTVKDSTTSWAGISVRNGRISLEHAILDHTGGGIEGSSTGRLDVRHSIIDGTGGVKIYMGVLEDNVVKGGGGIVMGGPAADSVHLLGGRIEGSNGVGLRSVASAKLGSVKPLWITGSRGYAVHMYGDHFDKLWPDGSARNQIHGNASDTLAVFGHIRVLWIEGNISWLITRTPEGDPNFTAGALWGNPYGEVTFAEPGMTVSVGGFTYVRGYADSMAIRITSPIGSPATIKVFNDGRYPDLTAYFTDVRLSNVNIDVVDQRTLIQRARMSGNLTLNAGGSSVFGSEIHGMLTLSASNIQVSDCEVSNSKSDGIRITAGSNVHVLNCNIFQNAGFGLNNQTAQTVDARGNWWGDPAGPAGPSGDGISGPVNYAGYCSNKIESACRSSDVSGPTDFLVPWSELSGHMIYCYPIGNGERIYRFVDVIQRQVKNGPNCSSNTNELILSPDGSRVVQIDGCQTAMPTGCYPSNSVYRTDTSELMGAGAIVTGYRGYCPAWMPDGTLTYFRGDTLFAGSSPYATAKALGGACPAWSPEGKSLVLGRTVNSSYGLFNISWPELVQQWTLVIGEFAAPAFSPDGSMVAMVRQDREQASQRVFDIWLINSSGSGLRKVTLRPVSSFVWSADGSNLLVGGAACIRDPCNIDIQPFGLYLIRVADGSVRKVSDMTVRVSWSR